MYSDGGQDGRHN
jgi:hypothetical protein